MHLYKKYSFSVLGLFAGLLLNTDTFAQTIPLTVIADLPNVLEESSGITVIDKNNIWSHNDSGNDEELYNFDSTGTLLRTLTISNSSNIDWEDITRDTAGNFYIGDIGNNDNNRQNLKIYIISNPDSITEDTTGAQVINYSYSDQYNFPPNNSLKNFDSEAMIAFGDSLYLFTKNRTDPFTGYTKMYRLPKTAGTYVAQLVDSFYTGPGPNQLYSITSASISPDQSRLMLIGYKKCWLFTDFTGADFFSGTCYAFDFADLTQKEAVCFITSDELYITDENVSNSGQKLYYMNLAPYVTTLGIKEMAAIDGLVFPNPFAAGITVKLNIKQPGNYDLILYDESGQTLYEKAIPLHTNEINIEKDVFKRAAGCYFVGVKQNNKLLFFKRVVKQ